MMKNWMLKLRMLIAGSALFGIYAVVALFIMSSYNVSLPLIAGLTLVFVLFQYIISQKLILKSVESEELPKEYSWIDNFVEQYSRDKNMKKPKVYAATMNTPNAFAFGRRGKGTVVVSKELLEKLEKEEIKGVVAHEMAHIENRDSIIMLIGQSISTIVGFAAIILSRQRGAGFFAALVAGQIAQIIVSIVLMAVSRYREYTADQTAASYMNTGEPLANALSKISKQNTKNKQNSNEVGALCIINPGEILSTHPPTEKRIKRLKQF